MLLGFPQALPHSPVGGLPEISALSVLEMRPSGEQRNLHICDGRAGEHAPMCFFFQMGQHQTLPVPVQYIFTAQALKLQAAAPGCRFQQQMHLGIVAQGFVMSYADHRCGNGFLIDNASGSELHREAEPLLDHGLQDFQLNLAHELQMDLSQALIPEQMELRIFLLQLPEFPPAPYGHRDPGAVPPGRSAPVPVPAVPIPLRCPSPCPG